jgi:hypothetical protein
MSWQEEMVIELEKAKNGEKTRIMKRYEHMTGRTSTHLYRIAKKYGYSSNRKKREDKGKCVLTELQIKFIAGLIYTTRREKKGTIMSVKKALERAEANDIIEPGSVSVSRLQELLRERSLNKKALNAQRPHMPMRSLHPNHVHLVDVSVCIQYYLKNKQLRIMNEKKFYKNKWENFGKIKQKIYRYLLTDHFSHTIYVKYYIAKGETRDNLWDFIVSAWLPKANSKEFPFQGVPFVILMDRGAANVNQTVIEFMKNMNVRFPEPGDHNPMRQGSVERAQNIVECEFESMLRVQSVSCVDELNHLALDWCRHMNSSKNYIHTRFGTPRMDCWMRIKENQLRECPEFDIVQDIYREPAVERSVGGDYAISFQGEKFRLQHVEGLVPNVSKVEVCKRPFTWPEIVVKFNEMEYTARPVGKADGGFDADAVVIDEEYKSMPESITQKEIKAVENLAYGENRGRNDAPFANINAFRYPKEDRPEFMPKKSTPMNITRDAINDRRISMLDLFKDLTQAGSMTPALNKAVRLAYGESITIADRDALVAAMEDGQLSVNSAGKLCFGGEDDLLKAVVN